MFEGPQGFVGKSRLVNHWLKFQCGQCTQASGTQEEDVTDIS